MTRPALAIEAASVTLGGFALRNIDLTLAAGEILVLLGPNGAGKSVCLEMIAGFHRPATGRISIAGRDVTDLPPEQRGVGLVFQNFGLFPHLTVAGNVALGLRAHYRAGHRQTRSAITDQLTHLGVSHLAGRYPQDLSPGEKQRVALARALAARPDLFLFDEPFSALDAPTRDMLRGELQACLREANLPAIFVSHDQMDAVLLADRVAVIDRGEIQQIGTPSVLLRKPANAFVAAFTGVENILPGRFISQSGEQMCIQVGNGRVYANGNHPVGDEIRLCIRAEEVGLCIMDDAGFLGRSGATNRLAARVTDARNLGALSRITVDCGFPLIAYLTNRHMRELGLAPGVEVIAEVEAESIHLLPPDPACPSSAPTEPHRPVLIPHHWR